MEIIPGVEQSPWMGPSCVPRPREKAESKVVVQCPDSAHPLQPDRDSLKDGPDLHSGHGDEW